MMMIPKTGNVMMMTMMIMMMIVMIVMQCDVITLFCFATCVTNCIQWHTNRMENMLTLSHFLKQTDKTK